MTLLLCGSQVSISLRRLARPVAFFSSPPFRNHEAEPVARNPTFPFFQIVFEKILQYIEIKIHCPDVIESEHLEAALRRRKFFDQLLHAIEGGGVGRADRQTTVRTNRNRNGRRSRMIDCVLRADSGLGWCSAIGRRRGVRDAGVSGFLRWIRGRGSAAPASSTKRASLGCAAIADAARSLAGFVALSVLALSFSSFSSAGAFLVSGGTLMISLFPRGRPCLLQLLSIVAVWFLARLLDHSNPSRIVTGPAGISPN